MTVFSIQLVLGNALSPLSQCGMVPEIQPVTLSLNTVLLKIFARCKPRMWPFLAFQLVLGYALSPMSQCGMVPEIQPVTLSLTARLLFNDC